MKHTTQLANRLLKRLHRREPGDDGVVRYPPVTDDAAQHWRHTGVCPDCSRRSVSVGRCAECGWNGREE